MFRARYTVNLFCTFLKEAVLLKRSSHRIMASMLVAESKSTSSACQVQTVQQSMNPAVSAPSDDDIKLCDSNISTVTDAVDSAVTIAVNVGQKSKLDGKTLSKRALKRLTRWELKKTEINSRPVVQESSWQKNKAKKEPRDVDDMCAESDLIDIKCLQETDYYFENGLRKVYPYYFEFTAYAKGRWFGQKLVDVFVEEFQNNSAEQCRKSIAAGLVTINGKRTSFDHIIKNGDFITNRVHRHELPVTDEPIEILVDNSDVLVVNKPSSMPVHPCGRYRHNSLLYILAKDYGYSNLRGVYRLDRLTSGLLIFGRTEAKTAELMKHIRSRNVEKEYVCRVDGKFPDGEVVCEEPIGALSHKLGIYRTLSSNAGGKESKTTFIRLSYDGKTSVVKCKPLTGRTHQIRVHLQYIGYPITNDPVYTGEVWGLERGKYGNFGRSDAELISALMTLHGSTRYIDDIPMIPVTESSPYNHNHCDMHRISIGQDTLSQNDVHLDKKIKLDKESLTVVQQSKDNELRVGFDPKRMTFDPDCKECHTKYIALSPDKLVMYLHAYSYKGPGWQYSTALPKWAKDDLTLIS